MTTNSLSFSELSDRDLLATVHRLASAERRATTRLIASLAELDARRLYLAEGYSSLFTYCTQALDLSEQFADGGAAVVENIQLRCRAHNRYESELWFRAAHPVVVRERPDYSGWLSTRSGPS